MDSDLGKIVLAKNIKINDKKVAKRECLIIAKEQDKYFMLAFVDEKNATHYDYDVNGAVEGKKVSFDSLIIAGKEKTNDVICNLELSEYYTTLVKLNNYKLLTGGYQYSFRLIKENVQRQIMDNMQKMLRK